ncbi:MAG: FkbM family methyltransferase [Candidatus Electrothrix sp. LOE2]|nr:FkbM family methyltransferase [Candidatus Electrothrix sp. LOE2]
MFIKKIGNRIKGRFFPSQQQLIVRKWREDGGDYALRFNYDLDEEAVVLDLGGYEGQWASDLFARYSCPIFIFEPVKSFATRIQERFDRNNKINIYPYGLGNTSRFEEIHISADGSSIFGKSERKEQIEIVDVKDWIEKNLKSRQDINLMKINIEGGEYELLDRLIETGLINRILNIQVQFHRISSGSQDHMERIKTNLLNTHEAVYQYEFVWENWTRKDSGSN